MKIWLGLENYKEELHDTDLITHNVSQVRECSLGNAELGWPRNFQSLIPWNKTANLLTKFCKINKFTISLQSEVRLEILGTPAFLLISIVFSSLVKIFILCKSC